MTFRLAAIAALFAALGACTPAPPHPGPTPAVGMANPASVACVRGGGKLEILNQPTGQVGVCVFTDGRRCEEWALFRDGRCVDPAAAPAPRRP